MAINIDEGEPGTFKDRYYLERDPHRFLEGALDRGLGGRHRRDLHLPARRVSRLPRDSGARDRGAAGQSAVPASADSSAPRRGRLHLRRRVRDDRIDRGQARRAAPASAVRGAGRACSTDRRSSTTWKRCTGCATSSRRVRPGLPATGGNGRKGLRSFSVSGRVKKPGVHLAPAGITRPGADRRILRRHARRPHALRRICPAARRAASCPRRWPTSRSISTR